MSDITCPPLPCRGAEYVVLLDSVLRNRVFGAQIREIEGALRPVSRHAQ